MFTNSFPQKGYVATKPLESQVATQPPPFGNSDYYILMMKSDQPTTINLNLQTQSRQYKNPRSTSVIKPPFSGPIEPLSTPNGPLQIPQPKAEIHTKIPKGPLQRNANSSKDSHS